jgi:hypothetical protein
VEASKSQDRCAWNAFTSGRFGFTSVPGDHYSILGEHIDSLADALRAILDA